MQRDMVRDLRAANGAQENGIVAPERVPAIDRQHAASLLIVSGAPRQAGPLHCRLVMTKGRVGHANSLLGDFRPYAVASDYRDAPSCHCKLICVLVRGQSSLHCRGRSWFGVTSI